MSSTTGNNGRFCNQLIRSIAFDYVAKKHNLYVTHFNNDKFHALGIDLFCGENKYNNTIEIKNNNYFDILNRDKIDYNLNPNCDYFQCQEIIDKVFQFIRSESVKEKIISMNPFRERYGNNNDVFIHVRLGDVSHHNPGLSYYLHCLSRIEFDNLYVATDSMHSNIISGLREKYPQMKMVNDDEVRTIQFGSTCKNIILSHGTFSAMIGYFGFFSDVWYLNREPGFCPFDVFKNRGWIPVDI
jgi:hypothetical protein